jgi:two-component system, OmpR family, sensor histidine kinase ChvG
VRRGWRRPRLRDARIVYRLLIVNALIVAVPIVGMAFARMHERQLLARLEADMIDQAHLLRAVVEHDPAGLQLHARGPMLADAARHTRTRIRLLDATGTVLSDSHVEGPPEGEERTVSTVTGDPRGVRRARAPDPLVVSDRREVRMALAGRYGAATRIWAEEDRVYLFGALPIETASCDGVAGASVPMAGHSGVCDGARRVEGVVYLTRSTAPVKAAMYQLRRWLLRLAGLSVAATAVVVIILAFTISRPLVRLTRAAELIASGDRARVVAPGRDRGDEIGQLARAFDRMATELDRRAAASRDLAADASHELRAPLSAIRGAAELLRDGAADDPDARARFLAMILDDADRLDRLVGRLLELARADAGTAVEPVVYPGLVTAAAERVRDTSVVVEYRADRSIVNGQRQALISAIDNLLANASAHARPGTAIRVRVTDEPDGALRTEVENHGDPIAADHQTRVWHRFYTTRPGGTGLGLSIVKTAVEAHGGTVGVASDAGATRFWFTLP